MDWRCCNWARDYSGPYRYIEIKTFTKINFKHSLKRGGCPHLRRCRLRLSQRYQIIMAKQPIYRVVFYNQGQIYEVFARQIYQSDLMGFIEIEDFVFGERTQVIVDPAEEKLKTEFAGVKRSYIPMHSLVRIDEVEKEGQVKVSDIKTNDKIAQFPYPVSKGTPGTPGSE